jgi:hypothetical protein
MNTMHVSILYYNGLIVSFELPRSKRQHVGHCDGPTLAIMVDEDGKLQVGCKESHDFCWNWERMGDSPLKNL